MNEVGYVKMGSVTLRDAPARDDCFKVVYTDAEMHEYGDSSDIALREIIHRHMTNEMTSVEMAASCVSEFPDTPWELRMELARQCWDESRHVRALYRRLRELGGYKGEFPIGTLEWNVTCAVNNLPGRLAIQNRTLEAGAMDLMGAFSQSFRAAGDNVSADMLDGINNDEVLHVRFSNRWIKRLAEHDPRTLMKVASAIRFLTDVNAQFQIKEGGEVNAVGTALASPENRIPAVNVEDRRLAEFSDDEINEILRQAGYRSLVSSEAEP